MSLDLVVTASGVAVSAAGAGVFLRRHGPREQARREEDAQASTWRILRSDEEVRSASERACTFERDTVSSAVDRMRRHEQALGTMGGRQGDGLPLERSRRPSSSDVA